MRGIYDEQAVLKHAQKVTEDPSAGPEMKTAAQDLLDKVEAFNKAHGSKSALQRMKHWIPVGDAIAAFAARYPAES